MPKPGVLAQKNAPRKAAVSGTPMVHAKKSAVLVERT
jgi:hypothetical protein